MLLAVGLMVVPITESVAQSRGGGGGNDFGRQLREFDRQSSGSGRGGGRGGGGGGSAEPSPFPPPGGQGSIAWPKPYSARPPLNTLQPQASLGPRSAGRPANAVVPGERIEREREAEESWTRRETRAQERQDLIERNMRERMEQANKGFNSNDGGGGRGGGRSRSRRQVAEEYREE